MEGGHTTLVDFVAEKPGLYLAECKSFCSLAHHGMLFNIKIVDNCKGRSKTAADGALKVRHPGHTYSI